MVRGRRTTRTRTRNAKIHVVPPAFFSRYHIKSCPKGFVTTKVTKRFFRALSSELWPEMVGPPGFEPGTSALTVLVVPSAFVTKGVGVSSALNRVAAGVPLMPGKIAESVPDVKRMPKILHWGGMVLKNIGKLSCWRPGLTHPRGVRVGGSRKGLYDEIKSYNLGGCGLSHARCGGGV